MTKFVDVASLFVHHINKQMIKIINFHEINRDAQKRHGKRERAGRNG